MIYTLFVAGSCVVPAVAGLVIGSGRWRQLALAAPGVFFWLGFAVWVKRDCEADSEAGGCSAAAASVVALAAVWLVGVGMSALARRERQRPGPQTVAAVVVGLVLVGAGYIVERLGSGDPATPPGPALPALIETSPRRALS